MENAAVGRKRKIRWKMTEGKKIFCMFISKNNIKSQKNYMNCLLLKFDKAVILYSNNWN